MSKTALAFLGIYGTAMVGALIYPPIGVWGYHFEWYNSPAMTWWGEPLLQIATRWNFYIAVAVIVGVLLHYDRYASVPFADHAQSRLASLWTINAIVVTLWAYDRQTSWEEAVKIMKMLIVYWCIIKTHSERKPLYILVAICILGCIHWGWEATWHPPRHRKAGLDIGGGETFGDNAVGGHAVAFLPLVGLIGLATQGKFRWVCLLGAPFIVNIVALSESRGAFLSLIAAVLATFVFSRGRIRKIAIVGLLLGSLCGLRLFHDQFWDRQSTILEHEDDESAMGRMHAWKAAWDVAKTNPLGHGGRAFEVGLGEAHMTGRYRTTHNMFFEVLVAWGVQGVVLVFSFIFVTCRDCWRLVQETWDGVSWPPPLETILALGVLCGLCSMLVCSVFLNRSQWELWWFYAAVTVCLKNIQDSSAETVWVTVTRFR